METDASHTASESAVPSGAAGTATESRRPMHIVFASSEATPFAKTGGLGDVVGALPRALAERGHQCAVFVPLYNCARHAGLPLQATEFEVSVPIGNETHTGRLWKSHLPRSAVVVFLVEHARFFSRDDPVEGRGLYQYRLPGGKMRDYEDNFARFLFFSRAVLEALPQLSVWPDVLHCNDWQTGLIPVYLREMYAHRDPRYPAIRSVFTIHNLAYQGIFWHWDMMLTGLDWKLFNWRQLEFYGKLNLMKAGIVFADQVSTVSATYAQEIQTPEHGCGLDDVLRYHRDKLIGIINGVDYESWNPETDPFLPVRYSVETVAEGKARCKTALQVRLGLPVRSQVPLIGMVTRLVEQKGLDLLAMASRQILEEDVQLVVLGTGDAIYHELLKRLVHQWPDRVAAVLRFDEPLAHQIEGGADMFLMPSRFEPAGLNQLYSLKYGTVPIVRKTGGLNDTVTDVTPQTLAAGTATGFVFRDYAASALVQTVRRAVQTYRDAPTWRRIQRTGMMQDWSWQRRAIEYEQMYARLRR